ncbi:MAG TPA: hypothetical protein VNT75_13655 [Symbiobacteriaceae bacterium]|nr:hypothetical protein [Symbiobacteriaceae bacterium]
MGRAIYADLEAFALASGAVALEGNTADDNPGALAFAQRRGFAVAHHVYPSRLDLARFDPAPFTGVLAGAEAAGFRFTSLADYPQTDEWFARFAHLYFELSEDVPGMAGRTGIPPA